MSRPKAPCGTTAAYARHKRHQEQPDQACIDAHTADRAARKGREVAAVEAVEVSVVDGVITLSIPSTDDARMLAAAVADRAYSLRQSAHKMTGVGLTASRHEQLHKRMMSALRAQGVLS